MKTQEIQLMDKISSDVPVDEFPLEYVIELLRKKALPMKAFLSSFVKQ